MSSSRHGFTLIELLLVIGIIAILASIVILSINPQRQLAQARDAQRRSDVTTILNALYQYSIDNKGFSPDSMSGSTTFFPLTGGSPVGPISYPICKSVINGRGVTMVGGTGVCPPDVAGVAKSVNLRALTGSYLTSIPDDPRVKTNTATGYTMYRVTKMANGRLKVSAQAEIATAGSFEISATR